jgi:hypothetical protein
MDGERSDVRLARMEERQMAHMQSTEDNFTALRGQLSAFMEQQGKANKAFWETRSSVIILEAKKAAAIYVVGLFGTLTIITAGAAAWIFEQREAILHFFRSKS